MPRILTEKDLEIIAACDPGIRETVKQLREYGFDTTDSGDGVSKPPEWYESGEAMPFPHVAVATRSRFMLEHANQLQNLLEYLFPDENWRVEATYCAKDETAVLLAVRDDGPRAG